jgi:antiviral helicase SKI2
LEAEEMYQMMKGARPPIHSRMTFHYDFILKTIQASTKEQPLTWLRIMEESYWFRQKQHEQQKLQAEMDACDKMIQELQLVEPFKSGCEKRFELEQLMSMTVNAARKKAQQELDSVKNKQMGPKWTKAWADYHTRKQLQLQQKEKEDVLYEITNHRDYIEPYVHFLYEMGYVSCPHSLELAHDSLTLKGILATEVNEGHPLLMTELYVQEKLHHLSGNDLVAVLASFQEEKETDETRSIQALHVPGAVKDALLSLMSISMNYQVQEEKYGLGNADYWKVNTLMVEPMYKWMEGEHASVICAEYGLFEGNFIRSVMKMANMLDEWLSMATYCAHVEQVEKITEVRSRIVHGIVISDSLYLRL